MTGFDGIDDQDTHSNGSQGINVLYDNDSSARTLIPGGLLLLLHEVPTQ